VHLRLAFPQRQLLTIEAETYATMKRLSSGKTTTGETLTTTVLYRGQPEKVIAPLLVD
jgi:hypothetical protein